MTREEAINKTNVQILEALNVTPETGLTSEQVKEKIKIHGPNSVITNKTTWWQILLRQFLSPFMYLLLGAVFVSLFLKDPLNSIFISIFIVLSAILGFYQEYYAEKTASLLKKYLATSVQCLRDGKQQSIPTEDLVPGDIITLSAGQAIPADIIFLETEQALVDESTLTGESIPVAKTTHESSVNENHTAIPSTMGMCGSMLISGTAKAIVITTGSQTAFGNIAKLSSSLIRRSSFAQEINSFSHFVLFFVIATIGCVFFGHIFIKQSSSSIFELALFAIALAVSIVPEGLPLVITFALSYGARKLTKKNVVVKRLSAIEDLGNINILCCDKTGTITKNELDIVDTFTQDQTETLLYAGLTCDGYFSQQPMTSFDQAIIKHLPEQSLERLKTFERITQLHFDYKSRYNAVLVSDKVQTNIIMRGAAESIVEHCKMEKIEEEKTMQWATDQGLLGRRIIALAIKNSPGLQEIPPLDENKDFSFIGLIAFEDPVKPTALASLGRAQQLGVAIKIITGDAIEVATAVGKEVGLVKNSDEVVTGKQLESASKEERDTLCENASVFARILPEQKFEIIEILQKKHNVGFLGEGINDAPALKAAHIGIAVHNSTDVAKDASDIILLQRSLSSMIDGIEQGRRVMENSFKYLRGMVTSNFSNFYTIAFVSLIIDYLPMLPIQLLLINLLTDFPLISISTDNTDPIELKTPKKNRLSEAAWLAVFLGIFSSIFDLIFFSRIYHEQPEVVRTNWFIYCIFSGILFFFAIRTKHSIFKAARPSYSLMILSISSLFCAIFITTTKLGAHIFQFVTPTLCQLRWTIGMATCYFIGMETAKLIFYYFYKNQATNSEKI